MGHQLGLQKPEDPQHTGHMRRAMVLAALGIALGGFFIALIGLFQAFLFL